MVSWVIHYVKTYPLYTLNMCSLLHADYSSIKLEEGRGETEKEQQHQDESFSGSQARAHACTLTKLPAGLWGLRISPPRLLSARDTEATFHLLVLFFLCAWLALGTRGSEVNQTQFMP